jgi:mono/diheme cytochrome c family protein
MKALNFKIILSILMIGLLSACGSQPTEAPASQPTEVSAPASEVPASPTEAVTAPTEAPTQAPTTESPSAAATISFANDIKPLFDSRCVNCHGGERVQEGLNLTSHANLMAGSNNGIVVTPGDADNSLLAEMVKTNKMPKRGPKLTPPQVQLIIDWINQGALNN